MPFLKCDEGLADRPLLRHSEEIGQGRGNICVSFAGAERDAQAAMQDHQRHLLTGVIGALPGRIVSVVGGDDHEIILVDLAEKRREPMIEFDEGARVAGNIAAVSEEHVEIDQVREDEAFAALGPEPG